MLLKEYWDNRYLEGNTPWDMGSLSPPLKEYFDQIKDKQIRILIPGGGFGHELDYLIRSGFSNAFLLEFSKQAINKIFLLYPDIPHDHVIYDDFFKHDEKYDLIIEQTFFCALEPMDRENYIRKVNSMLNENGTLAGVWFDFPLTVDGPPFGGSKGEYESLLRNYFSIKSIDRCYNSISPRQGNELFIIAKK